MFEQINGQYFYGHVLKIWSGAKLAQTCNVPTQPVKIEFQV
jgi:hypothetical protein